MKSAAPPNLFCPRCDTWLAGESQCPACDWQAPLAGAKPGAERWRRQLSHQPVAPYAILAAAKERIFVCLERLDPEQGRRSIICALEPARGDIAWQYELPGPRVAREVVVCGDLLLVASEDTRPLPTGEQNALTALDVAGGEIAWQFSVPAHSLSPPAILGDRLFFTASNGRGYGVSAADGAPLWECGPLPSWAHSRPAVGEQAFFIGGWSNQITRVNAQDGSARTLFQADSESGWFSTPLAAYDGRLFAVFNERTLYAIDAATGEQLWSIPAGRGTTSSPLAGPCVYTPLKEPVGADGLRHYAVHAYDLADGGLRWRHAVARHLRAPMLLHAGLVIAGSDDGHLYALDAEEGHSVWQLDAGQKLRCTPAVCDGSLVFCRRDGVLIAVEWRPAALNSELAPADVYRQAQEWQLAGLAAAMAGDMSGAAADFLQAGEPYRAAQLYALAGRHAEAGRAFEQAGRHKTAAAHYLQVGDQLGAAHARYEGGDFEGAANLYVTLERYEDAAGAFEKAGLVRQAAAAHVQAGDLARAADLYLALKQPQEAAQIYVDAGDVEGAVSVLLTAGLAPAAAELLSGQGRLEEAVALLLDAGEPAGAADIWLAAGRLQEAAQVLLNAGDPPAAAAIWQAAGRPEEAAPIFEEAELWLEAAEAWQAAGQPLAAARCYEQAGELLKAANLYRRHKRIMQAIDLYTRLNLVKVAAGLLEEIGEWPAAAAAYRTLNPPDRASAARCYKEAGEWDRAARQYEKGEMWAEAATCWQQVGETERAISLLISLNRLPEAAELLEQEGAFERSAELWQQYGDLENSVRLYQLAGQDQKALDLLTESGHWQRVVQLAHKMDAFEIEAYACLEMAKEALPAKRIDWYLAAGKAFERAALRQEELGERETAELAELWEQAGSYYDAGLVEPPEKANECRREALRLRGWPDLAVRVEAAGELVAKQYHSLFVWVTNVGFGAASQIAIRVQGNLFEGDAKSTQNILGLRPNQKRPLSLRVCPTENAVGTAVPMDMEISYMTPEGLVKSRHIRGEVTVQQPRDSIGMTPYPAGTPQFVTIYNDRVEYFSDNAKKVEGDIVDQKGDRAVVQRPGLRDRLVAEKEETRKCPVCQTILALDVDLCPECGQVIELEDG